MTTPNHSKSRAGTILGQFLYYVLFNGCTIAYFNTLHPRILAQLLADPAPKDIKFGLSLLGLQVLEIVGLWFKYPLVERQVKQIPSHTTLRAIGSFLVAISVLGHISITLLISMAISEAFGLGLEGTPALVPGLLSLVFIIMMLLKDFMLLISLGKYTDQNELLSSLLAISQRLPRISAYLADGLLLLFSLVAYTVTWGQMASLATISIVSLGQRVIDYAGAIIAFCLFFPATHPLSVAEAWLVRRPRFARLASFSSFLITMVSAIANLPTSPAP